MSTTLLDAQVSEELSAEFSEEHSAFVDLPQHCWPLTSVEEEAEAVRPFELLIADE